MRHGPVAGRYPAGRGYRRRLLPGRPAARVRPGYRERAGLERGHVRVRLRRYQPRRAVLDRRREARRVRRVPGQATRSEVRLLDVTAPGSDLLANSKPVCEWPALGSGTFFPGWRGVKVTPDGRTVVITEEWASGTAPARAYDQLLKCSAATGQVTTVLNDRNTTGRLLVRAGDVHQRHRERAGRHRRAQGQYGGHPARGRVHADPLVRAHGHRGVVARPPRVP